MSTLPENWSELCVDGPAVYRVRVRGHVDVTWSDRLGGLQITNDRPSAECELSTLIGRVRDQSTLAGVLNAIWDMRLPVLSVECLEVESRRAAASL